MKKITGIILTMMMVLSCTSVAFAETKTSPSNSSNDTANEIEYGGGIDEAINAITDQNKKDMILEALTTPMYVTVESGETPENYDIQDQRTVQLINDLSKLSNIELEKKVSSTVSIAATAVMQDQNSQLVKTGNEMVKCFAPEKLTNIVQEKASPSSNAVLKSKTACSKSKKYSLKDMFGTVLYSGNMHVNWTIDKSKVTRLGTSYTTNKSRFYTYKGYKVTKKTVTNKRGNAEIQIRLTAKQSGVPHWLNCGVYVYNNGKASFY